MKNIFILEATEDICDELAYIKKRVWETTYRGIYPNEKLDKFDIFEHSRKFKEYILSSATSLYVACHNNTIIGYMAIGKSPHRTDSPHAEIVLLYILKEYQGLGAGRALFDFAKRAFKRSGEKNFRVYCNKYNHPAQKFYEKMGGTIIAVDEDNLDRSIPQITYNYELY